MELTSPDNLEKLINIINDGTPLDEIAQVVLYKGYTEGLFNPDLMLLLIEPTLYLLIAIADYADINDYILYEGEDTDPDGQIPDDDVEPIDIDVDERNEVEEKGVEDFDKMEEPKGDSLSESLLAKVKTELPQKVASIKENR